MENFGYNKYLGYGYDIFGGYAQEKSIKNYCIFDIEKIKQDIEFSELSYDMIEAIYGNSIEEYSKKLAMKVGLKEDVFYFYNYLLDTFPDESIKKNIFFTTFMETKISSRISLKSKTFYEMKELLSDDFKEELKIKKASYIFDKYGTHFITSAYLGNRVDFISTSQLWNEENSNDLLISLNEKFKEIRENKKLKVEHNEILERAETKVKLCVNSGEELIIKDFSNTKYIYQFNLIVDKQNNRQELCNFDKDSLFPIWDLADNSKRSQDLKLEYIKRISLYENL